MASGGAQSSRCRVGAACAVAWRRRPAPGSASGRPRPASPLSPAARRGTERGGKRGMASDAGERGTVLLWLSEGRKHARESCKRESGGPARRTPSGCSKRRSRLRAREGFNVCQRRAHSVHSATRTQRDAYTARRVHSTTRTQPIPTQRGPFMQLSQMLKEVPMSRAGQ